MLERRNNILRSPIIDLSGFIILLQQIYTISIYVLGSLYMIFGNQPRLKSLLKLKMNINNLASELKFVNRIGQTFSVQERCNLQTAVIKLCHEYQHEQFNVWGRVQGISHNYYIVEGCDFKGCTNFPRKKFFWSSDDFKFAELPTPRTQFSDHVKSMSDFFTGQHQKILLKSQQQDVKTIKHAGESFQVKAKNFTELDRLSIFVTLVQQQCQIVPLGAFKMIPTHELIRNPDFRGLKMDAAKKGSNYLHLRAPQNQEKRTLIECDKALERVDFMDSIQEDSVKKSWSIQTDESGAQVTVRSLLWPGYVGYHRANSCIFGGVYLGNGIRCHDLPFIL